MLIIALLRIPGLCEREHPQPLCEGQSFGLCGAEHGSVLVWMQGKDDCLRALDSRVRIHIYSIYSGAQIVKLRGPTDYITMIVRA